MGLLEAATLETSMLARFLAAVRNTLVRLFSGDTNATERQKGQRKQTDQRLERDARQADDGERK